MPRKDFALVINTGQRNQDYDLSLFVRRDLATAQELTNAPGVLRAVHWSSPNGTNETVWEFFITLDPLYETKEEARADFEKWLQDRTVKLDGDVWNTDDPRLD